MCKISDMVNTFLQFIECDWHTVHQRYQCRIKQDHENFAMLLNLFAGTKYIEAFMTSAYIAKNRHRDDMHEVVAQFASERNSETMRIVAAFVGAGRVKPGDVVRVRHEQLFTVNE